MGKFLFAFIISNIIKFFIPLGLFIWALFMPHVARYVYVALYALFAAYLFTIDKMKPTPSTDEWSSQEIEVIRKYHLSLRFPFGAKDMSCHLNGFRWSGILWVILFLVNQMWICAGFTVIAFFVTADISVRLDPHFFLGQAVNSGQIQFMQELSTLNNVANKYNKRS